VATFSHHVCNLSLADLSIARSNFDIKSCP